MTTGLGIFLAGGVIGLAILLLNPQIRRLIGIGFVWLIVAIIVGGIGFYFYHKQNDPFQKLPVSNPGLLGIKVGDSRIDVIYKLGEPSSKSGQRESFSNGKLSVTFDAGIAKNIIYSCSDHNIGVDLNGISCGAPLSKIKEKFKDKVKEYCLLGTPSERIYIVPDFNSMYVLKQDSTFLLSIRPSSTPIPQKWMSCNAAKYLD